MRPPRTLHLQLLMFRLGSPDLLFARFRCACCAWTRALHATKGGLIMSHTSTQPIIRDASDLLTCIDIRTNAEHTSNVLLVGAPLTTQAAPGARAVLGGEALIELIRSDYKDNPEQLRKLNQQLNQTNLQERVDAALEFTHSAQLVRRAVVHAYKKKQAFRTLTDSRCEKLEKNCDGWHLPKSVVQLGSLLAADQTREKPRFPWVLTPNFDPLIEIAVRRAGGRASPINLADDGSLHNFQRQKGVVRIVHYHGSWYGRACYRPAARRRPRPNLQAALQTLLGKHTLVVLAYSGRDDVFMAALLAQLAVRDEPVRLLWGFHEADSAILQQRHAALLQRFEPGLELGAIELFRGVQVQDILARLADRYGRGVLPRRPRTRFRRWFYAGLVVGWTVLAIAVGIVLQPLLRDGEAPPPPSQRFFRLSPPKEAPSPLVGTPPTQRKPTSSDKPTHTYKPVKQRPLLPARLGRQDL